MKTSTFTEIKAYRWICPTCDFANDLYDELPNKRKTYLCWDCGEEIIVNLPLTGFEKTPGEKKTAVIDHIKDLREKRNTFKEIASILNSSGVATFSGKGIWHAQTIQALLKRLEEE